MGYVFLGLALLAGVTKGYCGKQIGDNAAGLEGAVSASALRMFFCVLIGAFVVLFDDCNFVQMDPVFLAIAALSGVSTSAFVVCWLICVKRGAYMMVDVFLMLGVLIPTIGSCFLLDESIKGMFWPGCVILFVAVIIMCSYNNSIKEKMGLTSFCFLLASGAANGLTDLAQKMFVRTYTELSISVFNFYTYIFSTLSLFIVFLVMKMKKVSRKSKSESSFSKKKILAYIVIMSVCLFANSYFKTSAAQFLDAAQLYPMNQGAALILSTLMSSICFGEKCTRRCVLGVLLAFAGLIIINVA